MSRDPYAPADVKDFLAGPYDPGPIPLAPVVKDPGRKDIRRVLERWDKAIRSWFGR